MANTKTYTIIIHRHGKERETSGTLAQLIQYFGYTLECGRSWQYEKGNKKINTEPKTIKSLITNLNNAVNNSAKNGYANEWFEIKE